MQHRETIIRNYIEAYNQFNVPAMTTDMADDIIFANIQNGETTMELHGLRQFTAQAEIATTYFSERRQTIKAFRHREPETEVDIEYFGILAIDLPNGMKQGEEIRLSGRSVFGFEGDKVVRLTDIS
ncbi:MAG TPA: nuclear transport factor 2 family protein [Phnomibacter sp.]|nr:nuclear transport factor 2 family protein [Phnomibacter sp.]